MCAATPQKKKYPGTTLKCYKAWPQNLKDPALWILCWGPIVDHTLCSPVERNTWPLELDTLSAVQGGASMDWIPKPDWNFKLSYHEGSETAFGGCLMLYTSVVSGYNVADQYTNAWYHTFETAFQLNINTPEDKSFFNGRLHHKLPTPVTRFAQMTFLNLSHLRNRVVSQSFIKQQLCLLAELHTFNTFLENAEEVMKCTSLWFIGTG